MLAFVCLLHVNEVLKIQSHDIEVIDEETIKHLCPVRAYAEWVMQTQIKKGFIFRKMFFSDMQQSSEQCLTGFRNHLLDIGIDPSPYGMHSFQHGGCQWLSMDLCWPIRKICEWGGWSTDFLYMTIPRKSFFDMNRTPILACRLCGRICHCS
ncbi:hypothetical protein BT96DRAFT_960015 [Gymnopus androsaceus JB14]|uniref:DNA breaking-rejoining enzyme n=1 Tax=Gymnopus androsaceus JB14 TaxID=1447944 RepID=A0A6A4GUW5_9AGAR|nr:hypothetical protein BT96DRAFT_960015 [Gymnopus androsaceus JB14]